MRAFVTLLGLSIAIILAGSCQGAGNGPSSPGSDLTPPSASNLDAANVSFLKNVLASRRTTGAAQFLRDHPKYDGRGTIIAICDSGFDVGHPSLQTTTDGKPKILDVVDMTDENTFQAPLELSPEQVQDGLLPAAHGGTVRVGQIPAKLFRVGYIHEQHFAGMGVNDLNRDTKGTQVGEPQPRYGTKSAEEKDNWDLYDFVLAQTADPDGTLHWDCYIDLDDDGAVDDETPLRSFRERRDTFNFDPVGIMTSCVNIAPDGSSIDLIIPEDSHGTIVAGIAAGNPPDDSGISGVAPGAQLLLIKLGYNHFDGSSSTEYLFARAFQYAVEHGADVINLSYGGSKEPKDDLFLDAAYVNWLTRQFGVVMTIAAGNSGPGLGSIGTPSASRYSVSIGSMISPATAEIDYGMVGLKHAKVSTSSSRGPVENGVAKPDLVVPGHAYAPVVRRVGGFSQASGTSMAGPHAAGCFSLLISALKQKKMWHGPEATSLDRFTNWRRLVRAMKMTARPLPGATYLDAGAGLVDVPAAYGQLRSLFSKPLGPEIEVTTRVPSYRRKRTGFGAYHRTVVPPTLEYVEVRALPDSFRNDGERAAFLRTYKLVCDRPWLRASSRRRGRFEPKTSRPLEVLALHSEVQRLALEMDTADLKPGLHVANLYGYDTDSNVHGSWNGPEAQRYPAFRLPVMIVVGESFSPREHFIRTYKNVSLASHEMQRFFLDVPYGTSAVQVTLRMPDARFGSVYAEVFTPRGYSEGHVVLNPGSNEPPQDTQVSSQRTFSARVDQSGIWEVALANGGDTDSAVAVDMEVRLIGFNVYPQEIVMPNGAKPGEAYYVVAKNLHGLLYGLRYEASIEKLSKSNHVKLTGDPAAKTWVLPDWCKELWVDFYQEIGWKNTGRHKLLRGAYSDLVGHFVGRALFRGSWLIRERLPNTGAGIYTGLFGKFGKNERLDTRPFRPKAGTTPEPQEPEWFSDEPDNTYIYLERYTLRNPVPIKITGAREAFALRRDEEKMLGLIWPNLSAVNKVGADTAHGLLKAYRGNNLVAEVRIRIPLPASTPSDHPEKTIFDQLAKAKKSDHTNGPYSISSEKLASVADTKLRKTVIGTLAHLKRTLEIVQGDNGDTRRIEKEMHFGMEPHGGNVETLQRAIERLEMLEAWMAPRADLIDPARSMRTKLREAKNKLTNLGMLTVPNRLHEHLGDKEKLSAADWLKAAEKIEDRAVRREALTALRTARTQAVDTDELEEFRKRLAQFPARKINTTDGRYYRDASELFRDGHEWLGVESTLLDTSPSPPDTGLSAQGALDGADGKESIEELDILLKTRKSPDSPWTAGELVKTINDFFATQLTTFIQTGEMFTARLQRRGGVAHLHLVDTAKPLTWSQARSLTEQAVQVYLDGLDLKEGSTTYYWPRSAAVRQAFAEALADAILEQLTTQGGAEAAALWTTEKKVFDFIRAFNDYKRARETKTIARSALLYAAESGAIAGRLIEEADFTAWLKAAWARDWTRPAEKRLAPLKAKEPPAVELDEEEKEGSAEKPNDPESEGTDTEPSASEPPSP